MRDIAPETAGQQLDANVRTLFRAMTLVPGAKPEEQTVALGPPGGEQLRAKAGDKAGVTLVLTRGRPRKLKIAIEPEQR